MKLDFNIQDLFNFFNVTGKGSLSKYELENGIKKLGYKLLSKDIFYIMRRYDLDGCCGLNYAKFERMCCPEQKNYAEELKKRKTNAKFGELTFSSPTQILIKRLIEMIIKNEKTSEKIRKKVNAYPKHLGIKIEKAFQSCDKQKLGYLTKTGIQKFMGKHKIFLSEAEVNILMNRYDKDLDGKISYEEYLKEVL